MNEYERGRRRVLVSVFQKPEDVSDKKVLEQIIALNPKITERCKERLLEAVHSIRDGDMNVTQAEEELKKELCC